MIFWLALILGIGLSAIGLLVFLITQPLVFPFQKKQAPISVIPEKLKAHVEKISREFFPRSAAFVQNLDKAAAYIKQEFINAGGNVSEQAFEVDGKIYRNVIARFGNNSKERIIIGAHYDAAGALPAADDNASGVAGLIELAYLLVKTDLPNQIELVAYSLEEPPYFGSNKMGSFVHARSLKDENAAVRLMISLEMIGYFSDESNSQLFPVSAMSLLYPSRGNFIAVVGNFNNFSVVRRVKAAMLEQSELSVRSINAPASIPGIDFSDHRNYWKFGYDAVMITDSAFYRNPNYHTSADTPEKLDYNRMSKVVEGVYYTVINFAK
ncbi:MAG: M28 family peptidase [Acidobacteriota bacterium]|nr:M28 family peptidase [Acidobacteriota bacterium]